MKTKNFFSMILLLVVSAVAFTSCLKDDDEVFGDSSSARLFFVPIPPALFPAGRERFVEHDRVFKNPREPPRRIVAQKPFPVIQTVHKVFNRYAIDDFHGPDHRAVMKFH